MVNMHSFQYDTLKQPQGHHIYGYSRFKGIFCKDNDDGFNIHSMISLFDNMESFIIFFNRSGYNESIQLNSAFIDDLYKTIDIIKNSRTLKRSFKQIIIVSPSAKTPIHAFIDKEESNLTKVGWKAMKKTFISGRRGECDLSLIHI